MKKAILLRLLSLLLLFVSCIGENMDDCPAMRHVVFKHHALYDPDEDFDRWIGNDVVLYIFQDKKLKTIDTISCEQIRNGGVYSFRKRYDGHINIAAWATPEGSTTGIPRNGYDDLYNALFVAHNMGAENAESFPVDLYLGIDSVTNDALMQETTHTIRMIHCACLVSVTVNDPAGTMQLSEDHYVIADGVMEKMDLRYNGTGREVKVCHGIQGANTTFRSGIFGVLPSADGQNLRFTLFSGDRQRAIVTTDLKAVSGGKIDITINLDASVVITADGWDIYPVSVEWM